MIVKLRNTKKNPLVLRRSLHRSKSWGLAPLGTTEVGVVRTRGHVITAISWTHPLSQIPRSVSERNTPTEHTDYIELSYVYKIHSLDGFNLRS